MRHGPTPILPIPAVLVGVLCWTQHRRNSGGTALVKREVSLTSKGTILPVLDYLTLRAAVEGSHVALRCRTELQPAGGPGDKVFPSTYGVPNGARTKYATEEYRENGETRIRVLLDSVASGANRHEVALQEALDAGEVSFPNPFVDFTIDPELGDLGRLSALQAPHRLADAIFRDSLLDGTLFRLSDLGRRVTESSPNNATALFLANPVAELMGMWDSTGPKGGLGSKFQRAFVSEIVGLNAQIGVKVGSRIDPLQIERTSAFVYESRDPQQGWTLNPTEARTEKGKPVGVGSKGELGRPSAVNHGNVAPPIDTQSGGVTIDKAVQTTVISLAALRKLRFPTAADGSILPDAARREAELAARPPWRPWSRGHRLPARARLRPSLALPAVPTHPAVLELVPRDGSAPLTFDVDVARRCPRACGGLRGRREAGLAWPTESDSACPCPQAHRARQAQPRPVALTARGRGRRRGIGMLAIEVEFLTGRYRRHPSRRSGRQPNGRRTRRASSQRWPPNGRWRRPPDPAEEGPLCGRSRSSRRLTHGGPAQPRAVVTHYVPVNDPTVIGAALWNRVTQVEAAHSRLAEADLQAKDPGHRGATRTPPGPRCHRIGDRFGTRLQSPARCRTIE